nr:MAG TPA: hypothetical protein [Caudoviricetes sp.]
MAKHDKKKRWFPKAKEVTIELNLKFLKITIKF